MCHFSARPSFLHQRNAVHASYKRQHRSSPCERREMIFDRCLVSSESKLFRSKMNGQQHLYIFSGRLFLSTEPQICSHLDSVLPDRPLHPEVERIINHIQLPQSKINNTSMQSI